MSHRDDRGFTLVEIVVAIVIVGILSAVVVVGVGRLTSQGTTAACQTSLDAARAAATAHWATTAAQPSTFTDMVNSGSLTAPSDATVGAVTIGTADWLLRMTPGASGAPPTFSCTASQAASGLTGRVYEDLNYGGGAGRDRSVAGAVGRPGVRIELYDTAGGFVSATTTDPSGDYAFADVAPGTYQVRAVATTVTSSRSGATPDLIPTVTYRVDASSGVPTPDTAFVGGSDPLRNEAPANDGTQTLAQLGSSTAAPQAIAPVQIYADLGGVDFGFSFSTVTNRNDSGAGSLRQVITNTNALGGDATLAQAGRAPGIEHVVFMLPNATTANGDAATGGKLALSGGLRPSFDAFTTPAGAIEVATIDLASPLPPVTAPLVLDAQTQPGWRDTSPVPVLELNGFASGIDADGIVLTAANSQLRGFAIRSFRGTGAVGVSITGSNVIVQGNHIGTNAAGTVVAQRFYSDRMNYGILVGNANGVRIGGTTAAERNVVSGQGNLNIGVTGLSSNTIIIGNYVGLNVTGTAAVFADDWMDSGIWFNTGPGTSGNRIGGPGPGEGNVIGSPKMAYGIMTNSSPNLVIQGNIIGSDVTGTVPINVNGHGIRIDNRYGATTTQGALVGGTTPGAANLITGNGHRGILITGGTNNRLQRNLVFGNGRSTVGKDIVVGGFAGNDGATTAGQPNLHIDTPTITSASLSGTTLTISGFIGNGAPSAAFPNATIEVFVVSGTGAAGGGQRFLGTITGDTTGSFSGTIDVGGAGLVVGSTRLTATAADASGNTSEYGTNVTVG